MWRRTWRSRISTRVSSRVCPRTGAFRIVATASTTRAGANRRRHLPCCRGTALSKSRRMMAGDVNTFMATMVAPSRPVPIARALALVRERYGFAPRAARLTGERDENFKLTTADGADYVLKIANPAESPAETDFQTAALLHIEKTDPALPCPRVLRDRTGGTHVRFVDEGVERTARLLAVIYAVRLVGCFALVLTLLPAAFWV